MNTNTVDSNVISFKVFSEEEHEVWRQLCAMQMKNLEGRVSKHYLEGWKALGLTTDRIPDFVEVNKRLKELNGWEVIMTNIVYEDNISWISSLADKKFRITDFIRDIKDIEYTPLPDIFHDVFGHLPFLGVPQYARILEKFGHAAIKAREKNEEQETAVSRLGWYGYEFGFMREEGELKAFGTGLVSSCGELAYAQSDKVQKVPYDMEEVEQTPISPEKYHEKLFVLESLDQLELAAEKYL
jgi:phenylalanine-4-hydroxylase